MFLVTLKLVGLGAVGPWLFLAADDPVEPVEPLVCIAGGDKPP